MIYLEKEEIERCPNCEQFAGKQMKKELIGWEIGEERMIYCHCNKKWELKKRKELITYVFVGEMDKGGKMNDKKQ